MKAGGTSPSGPSVLFIAFIHMERILLLSVCDAIDSFAFQKVFLRD